MAGRRKSKERDVEVYPSKIEGKVDVDARSGICEDCGNNSAGLVLHNDYWLCEDCQKQQNKKRTQKRDKLKEWSRMG
ncbi:MAG: hypothetical protein HYS53_02100 [Candidatus Aenigmarchaeota archaeon]|nr:hypothetical protein [Candidatus Aenigmarchaeota archaeon]